MNECLSAALNDCHMFADCYDEQDGYSCKCRQGYKGDGVTNCKSTSFDIPYLASIRLNPSTLHLSEGQNTYPLQGKRDGIVHLRRGSTITSTRKTGY